jgi:HD-like signal output (HDOD) protein
MNAHVIAAIKKSAAVPTIPRVVTRFLEVTNDPNYSYDDIVKVLSTDAGTVSEILRLANSALFGLPGEVTSLRQALTLLGPKRTRSLVLGRCLVDQMNKYPAGSICVTYFWRRSLVTAVLSSRLADVVAPEVREEAFLSGLLADIGVAILSNALGEQYEPIASQYCPNGTPSTEDWEHECVGVTHAEVSAMVLSDWGLPEPICKAVNLHMSSTVKPTDPGNRIARILNSADRVGCLLCELPKPDQASLICAEAMAFIGADLDALAQTLSSIEKDVEELAAILKTDVIPSNVYHLIARAIQKHLSPSSA